MLKIFFLVILAGIVVLLQISAFLIVALIIALLSFLSSWGRYRAAMKKEPSRMVCKNCGSANVRIQNQVEGWTADASGVSTGSSFPVKGTYAGGKVNQKINRQHIAVCADCGFDSPYVTLEEIEAEQKKAKSSLLVSLLFVLVLSLALIFGASSLSSKDDETDKSSTSSTEIKKEATEKALTTSKSTKTAVSGVEVTKETEPISDFMYDLSGDTVKLRSANTRKSVLTVAPSYMIDGKEYKTDVSDFHLISGGNGIETIIFSEGISEIATAVFNCSDIKNIFFPKSMKTVYDYTLSYLHPDEGEKIRIYYAGTQDEWANIFTEYKRTSVSDAETAKEKGAALADKLNEMIGTKYDSSLFDYYFSSTPADLTNNLDYEDVAVFESALNAGEDLTGKTVRFIVSAFEPASAFGFNMQTGEHLNFCSEKDPKVSVGDTVTVKVEEVTSMLGSWIISYKMVG